MFDSQNELSPKCSRGKFGEGVCPGYAKALKDCAELHDIGSQVVVENVERAIELRQVRCTAMKFRAQEVFALLLLAKYRSMLMQ